MPTIDSSRIGAIERFMVEDHVGIDGWVARCERPDGSVDLEIYERLRQALLRHIGMEERILLPYARAKRGGEPLDLARRLHADHGEIAKLLVRSPNEAVLGALRELLARHNPLEEGPEGIYAACDRLAGDGAQSVVDRLRAQPEVPLAKYYDGPSHPRH
jgi:hypothetical protein